MKSTLTFLMAWHLAASWYPTNGSGEHIFKKGKSEFLAICAARAVLPLFGGPVQKYKSI